MNLENYLVFRLKIDRLSKPNSILAQIGICSVDALHHNVKSTHENSNLEKKLKVFLKSKFS